MPAADPDPRAPSATSIAPLRDDASTTLVVPVVAEEVAVATTAVRSGAVRVRIEVENVTVPVVAETTVETVVAERVPRGTAVAEARAPWHEGDTFVVPVYEEVVVCERRLVLKEEVRLTRRRRREAVRIEEPVRRERAVVERQQPDGTWIAIDDPPVPPAGPDKAP